MMNCRVVSACVCMQFRVSHNDTVCSCTEVETRRPVVHTDLQGAQAGGTEPAPLSSNDDSSNLSSEDAISDVPD